MPLENLRVAPKYPLERDFGFMRRHDLIAENARYPERGDGSDRRKASHMGFIHRMAKRENVQPFACPAGQFSTQGQVLREQVVQCGTRDPRDREFPSRLFFHASPHECRAYQAANFSAWRFFRSLISDGKSGGYSPARIRWNARSKLS